MINARFISNWAVIFFGLIFGLKFIFLSNGDVINHYPLISQDGFDWYTEGIYLINSFFQNNLPNLPILRPPTFVLITSLDFLTGSRGLVLSTLYSLSIVMTYFFILWIIDRELGVENKDAWFLFPLAISVTVYPINLLKGYLLSDSITVCLSLFSVFILIKYFNEKKIHLLVLSGFIALLAGLTQTYGLIPYLIFIGIKLMFTYKNNKAKNVWYLLLSLVLIFSLFILITYFWRHFLKHNTTPSNFELLKLNFHMLSYYINTWGYYFFPFIIFFILIKHNKEHLITNQLIILSSFAVTLTLACLCFIYQWPDARFTYYLWPWALISFFLLFKPVNKKTGSISLVGLMIFVSFVIPPVNPWGPLLKSISFSYHKNWAVNYFGSQSVDRGLNNCNTPNCDGNEWIASQDAYVKSVIPVYLMLKETGVKFNK